MFPESDGLVFLSLHEILPIFPNTYRVINSSLASVDPRDSICFEISCQFPNPYCSIASKSRISSLADHLGLIVEPEPLFSLDEDAISDAEPGNRAKLPESKNR